MAAPSCRTDVVALHRDLVRIRSVSGEEGPLVERVCEFLESWGHRPVVDGRNVVCVRGGGRRGLLFNTHTDTVPPSVTWTVDPLAATVHEGRVVGLGAADAKASLATMLMAFVATPAPGGRLILAATCDEETGGDGMERVARTLPGVDGAVVGEPTAFVPCTAQKGLLKIEVVARGRRAHAARPHQGDNAIERAVDDVVRLRQATSAKQDPLLGLPTIAVTRIQGGLRSNVIPDECRFVVDVRTTPAMPNETMLEWIRGQVSSEVEVLSDRIRPMSTDPDEPIVGACLAAADQPRVAGFGGISDMVWLEGVPAVVLGPGSPQASHQADEWVDLEDLHRGVEVYRRVIEGFLASEGVPEGRGR